MARDFRPSRMQKSWVAVSGFAVLMTGNSTNVTAGLAVTTTGTILRCLTEYCIAPSSAPAANDGVTVAVGLGIVSDDAFTLGAAALPDPVGDEGYPWLYWASHRFMFPGTDPEAAGATTQVRRVVDARAMRKIRPEQTITWVVQYVDSVGTPPMRCDFGSTRMLLAT